MHKCSHCEAAISSLTVNDIYLTSGGVGKWKGVSYGCPSCEKIVSAEMSPSALQENMVELLQKKMRVS